MEKSVDEIAEEENVNFIKIDVDQFEELATKQYNVTSVPTLLYLKNGKVTAKLEGFKARDPRNKTCWSQTERFGPSPSTEPEKKGI